MMDVRFEAGDVARKLRGLPYRAWWRRLGRLERLLRTFVEEGARNLYTIWLFLEHGLGSKED